ncbi:hypothetical protein C8R43DRAFT_1127246 [Mycena crocata]|nr:hypothetical protein C8R43DRAFT_1127246 [Mycena crocata]
MHGELEATAYGGISFNQMRGLETGLGCTWVLFLLTGEQPEAGRIYFEFPRTPYKLGHLAQIPASQLCPHFPPHISPPFSPGNTTGRSTSKCLPHSLSPPRQLDFDYAIPTPTSCTSTTTIVWVQSPHTPSYGSLVHIPRPNGKNGANCGKHYFKCQIFFGHCDPVPHLPFLNLASRSFEAFQVHSKFKLDRLVQLGVEYNGGLLTGSLTWSGESDTLKLHVLGAISSLQSALQTLDPRVAFKFHFNVQSSRTFVALTNLRSTSRAMKEGFDFELVQDRPSDSLSSPNGESICV